MALQAVERPLRLELAGDRLRLLDARYEDVQVRQARPDQCPSVHVRVEGCVHGRDHSQLPSACQQPRRRLAIHRRHEQRPTHVHDAGAGDQLARDMGIGEVRVRADMVQVPASAVRADHDERVGRRGLVGLDQACRVNTGLHEAPPHECARAVPADAGADRRGHTKPDQVHARVHRAPADVVLDVIERT